MTKIQFVALDRSRKTIYLGRISKREVTSIKVRVESLVTAQLNGHVPDDDTTRWVAKIGAPLRKKLIGVGLVEAPNSSRRSATITVSQFCDEFIAGRPEMKPRTLTNYEQTKAKLVEFFGHSQISRVTALEADRFRSWLKGVQGLAESTVRTHIKNAKLIFKAADKGDLIKGNPFDGHKTAIHANASRMVFVERETIDKVMKACPNSRWKAIVALCRFGGLRCPSEVLTLKWEDVNFDQGRMTVRAPKTEHHEGGGIRVVPLFPEVRAALEELNLEPEAAEYVIKANDRTFAKNLRTVFLKILKRAKVEPWGKPFQNLRSSRETELSHEYPLHIVVAWLGNSMKTAKKHYLQIRDVDFEKAIGKNDARNDADECRSNRNLPEVEIAKPNEKALNRRKTPQNKAFLKTEQYPRQESNLRPEL